MCFYYKQPVTPHKPKLHHLESKSPSSKQSHLWPLWPLNCDFFFNLVAEERKWRTRLTTVQRNAKDDHQSCVLFHIKKKDISSLKRSSLFLAYLSEILMHQKPILIKHSRDPIIGKKPLSSMCCLWQPITAASDHLKWHLTGNICIFFTSWWDQTEEAPRDCVSKLPRELLVAGPTYGLVGTWKWHWGGKVREVLIHSIQMS